MSLRCLLFDVDGTLADTEEVHRQSFNAAFAAAGLDWVWSVERYGELLSVTGGRERIRHFMDTHLADFPRPADLDAWIAGLHRAKTEYYTRTLAEGRIPLRTGVRRLIEEARQRGLRLAIATTTTPANVTALLEHSLHPDSVSWFEVIAAGDVVPAKKPAPDIYTYALQALGVDAHECLSLEDSGNGVRSSLAAGVHTVVTLNDYTRDQDVSGAQLVLDHLGEPGLPMQVLTGHDDGASCVDVDLLMRVHARIGAPR